MKYEFRANNPPTTSIISTHIRSLILFTLLPDVRPDASITLFTKATICLISPTLSHCILLQLLTFYFSYFEISVNVFLLHFATRGTHREEVMPIANNFGIVCLSFCFC
jgi:hypothetical protein